MNHLDLFQRLAVVGGFVPESVRLADIGSDHIYLPVALMPRGKVKYVAIGEVVQGPHESACEQAQRDGLEDRIAVRLVNSLDAIQPQDAITAVTIMGVGGSLIREILEVGKLYQRLGGQERLILQPNIGGCTLRSQLQENQYEVQSEKILEENKRVYGIIVAEKEQKPITYNEMELMFGSFLLEGKSEISRSEWTRKLQQRRATYEQFEQTASQEARQKQIKRGVQMIEEALET